MKKCRLFCFILASILFMMALPGCASKKGDSDRISVVCTIFPEFDWGSQIVGEYADSFDIALLTDNGTDMHSYQVTVSDIARVSSCDVFIYVGGESDEWVEDVLASDVNKDIKVVNLLEVLGDSAKEEEIVEGMKCEPESDSELDEPEYDEHVWLSIKESQIFVSAIAEAIAEADPEHADYYRANSDAYNAKLGELDAKYQQVVDNASNKTLIFADRFPFRYLVDDYGLNYYAAFSGCSAETEASFSTVTFLAEKMDEYSLDTVLVLEGSDKSLANTVVANTASGNKNILVLDSLQSSTRSEIESGKSYIGVMESNLEVLKTALD